MRDTLFKKMFDKNVLHKYCYFEQIVEMDGSTRNEVAYREVLLAASHFYSSVYEHYVQRKRKN